MPVRPQPSKENPLPWEIPTGRYHNQTRRHELPEQTPQFKELCESLGLQPTRRQWSKFLRKEGAVHLAHTHKIQDPSQLKQFLREHTQKHDPNYNHR